MITVFSTTKAVAGTEFKLTCNATTIQYLTPNAALTLNWSGHSVNTSGVTEMRKIGVGSVLSFNPLRTTHGENYTCVVAIHIPALNLTKENRTSMEIVVQRKGNMIASWQTFSLFSFFIQSLLQLSR